MSTRLHHHNVWHVRLVAKAVSPRMLVPPATEVTSCKEETARDVLLDVVFAATKPHVQHVLKVSTLIPKEVVCLVRWELGPVQLLSLIVANRVISTSVQFVHHVSLHAPHVRIL